MRILSLFKPANSSIYSTESDLFGIILCKELSNSNYIRVLGNFSDIVKSDLLSSPNISYTRLASNPCNMLVNSIKQARSIYSQGKYDILHIHISSIGIIRWINKYLVNTPINVVCTISTPYILGRYSFRYKEDGIAINEASNIKLVYTSEYIKSLWESFAETDGYVKIPNSSIIQGGSPNLFSNSKDSRTLTYIEDLSNDQSRALDILSILKDINLPFNINIVDLSETSTQYRADCYSLLNELDSTLIKCSSYLDLLKSIESSSIILHLLRDSAVGIIPLCGLSASSYLIYEESNKVVAQITDYPQISSSISLKSTYEEISDNLKDLLNDSKINSNQLSHSLWESKYDISDIANKYINIYEDLLTRKET